MIKTILTTLNGMPHSEKFLEVALKLSITLGAHLEVINVVTDPRDSVAYVGEGMTSVMVSDVLSLAEKEADEQILNVAEIFKNACNRNRVRVSEELGFEGATSFLSVTSGREEDVMASRGRVSDLICLNRPGDQNGSGTFWGVLEVALFDTGRGVLMVPSNFQKDFGESIVIYWNDSREAARTISLAMPFLKRAHSVAVGVVADGDDIGSTGQEVTKYLARHDVEAHVVGLKRHGGDGEWLLNAAAEIQADMIVMGAYTNNRLRRLVFGGITRDVLSRSALPVFLSR